MNSIREFDGSQIREPGIYAGVPIERYHRDPLLFSDEGFSISSTGLKLVLKRPLAYWASSPYNPERELEKDPSEALEFGRAAHILLLGEDGFREQFVIRPDKVAGKDWNGNRAECRQWKADMNAAGFSILTKDDMETIVKMARAISKHPAHAAGWTQGIVEHSIFTKVGDIWLKSRPDLIPTSSGDVVDFKTATDLSYEFLSRQISNLGYHIQAAMTKISLQATMGVEAFTSFSYLFVEKQAPYDVRFLQLKDADIELGVMQIRKALAICERCLAENDWPGYDGYERDVRFIEMPSWARTRILIELGIDQTTK